MNNITLNNIKIKMDGEFVTTCPFPIGFIYMSANNVSPASLFGGTWTQISDSRVWLPKTSYNETGGSNTITIANMPSHNHTGTTNKDGWHDHTVTGTISSNGNHNHWLSSSYTNRASFPFLWNESAPAPVIAGRTMIGSWSGQDRMVAAHVYNANSHGTGAQATAYNGTHNHSFTSGRAWSGNANTGDFLSQHTHSFTTSSKGSGSTYYQPYRTCYCWVRTA